MTTRPSQNSRHLTPQEIREPQSSDWRCLSLRPSKLCGACLLTFVLLHSSFILSPAAPPPELTVLRQQYDKVIAERVTAPFDASLGELNTKFATALANAITGAKQAGKLDDVLAIQDDQKRLTDKLPLPDDTDTTPEALKTLRNIYRGQLKKLEDTRAANHAAILPAYTAKLTDLEATLVKNDRIDEAKELRMYREGLVADVVRATAAATPTASPEVSTPKAKRELPVVPPEKERDVVLAILDLGQAEIRIKTEDGSQVTITSPETLPAGIVQMTELKIIGLKGGKSRPGKMLAPLAGLPLLWKLTLQHFPLHDDDMDALGALPSLREIYVEFCAEESTFTGKTLNLLAAPENLQKAAFSTCPLKRPAFEALARCSNLTSLMLDRTPVTDDDLKHLAGLTALKSLDLRWTDTTIAGLRHLKQLTVLESLGWGPDPGAEAGGFHEMYALFPGIVGLKFSRREGAKPEHYAGISALLKLNRVSIIGDDKPGIMLAAIAKTPQIEMLHGYLWDGVQDADLAPLQTAQGITTVFIDLANSITAKGLMHFSKMPKLKKLTLQRFKKISDADIDAFKKVRPDVEVKFTR